MRSNRRSLYPARIVRFDAHTADQSAAELPNGIGEGGIAARSSVERLTAQAADGTAISRLARSPAGRFAGKAGPAGSLRSRRSAWVLGGLALALERASPHERGYAVLMPDPAISLGYGQQMVQRGWGKWGEISSVHPIGRQLMPDVPTPNWIDKGNRLRYDWTRRPSALHKQLIRPQAAASPNCAPAARR